LLKIERSGKKPKPFQRTGGEKDCLNDSRKLVKEEEKKKRWEKPPGWGEKQNKFSLKKLGKRLSRGGKVAKKG